MDDLISRAAAIKAIEALMQRYRQIGAECDRDGALFARERIKKLPAVDAAPVVRCRDCKYSDVIYDTTLDTMPLKCLNIRYGGVMPDWYCEHGERRDDDALSGR